MTSLHVIARGWLESENLAHLLPDPFTHEEIRGAVATYYPGGCMAFLQACGVDTPVEGRTPLRRSPARRRLAPAVPLVNVELVDMPTRVPAMPGTVRRLDPATVDAVREELAAA
jgi:hypothetical protein